MNTTPWASHPLENEVNRTLLALERGISISLITTFDLKTCDANDTVENILACPDFQPFDYIPVRDQDNIVGVWQRPQFSLTKEVLGGISMGKAMQPLHESILISASASLISFIEDADKRPFRLVLHGHRIIGIVTMSDLQKLAVRPMLFTLITCVELLLADWLRQYYPEDKDWMATLSEGRSILIEQRWINWRRDNTAIDKISASEFCDKREAALKLGAFARKTTARKQLQDVEWLRHAVMYSGGYALTPENAQRVAYTVRAARELIQVLQDSLKREKGNG